MGIDAALNFLCASKSQEHTTSLHRIFAIEDDTSKGGMLFLHRFESAWAFKKFELSCTQLDEAQIKDTFGALQFIQLE